MNEPRVVDIKRFVDDRGSIDQVFNSDYHMNPKRAYIIKPMKGVCRGLHGHREEKKAFYVVSGIVKFITYPITTGFKEPIQTIEEIQLNLGNEKKTIKTFVLSSEKSQALLIPEGYYNGFVGLTEGCIVLGFSDKTYEESIQDDIRLPYDVLGEDIWEVRSR